ncbi:sulfite exporter TauE/SafE family protein [Parvularcula marina]|uniref:Probable membrane transporter protein n=1 Tax=Parvularcula marina TaxID=2292771 RepID=A0A371RKS5_9PROT|nr:sulfite exporter TauE/SafE family protein [Parvularcula marina]RFB06053.1 sulfite exporter TauE/SafE family protein [Parvularcula marina]
MTLTAILVLVLTGLGAGFAGGLFGIGGGVVIVPALYAAFTGMGMAEDEAIKTAIATSMATIIVTSIRSVMRHHRHDNVDWPVLKAWMPGLAVGAILGSVIARYIDGQVLTGIFGAGLILLATQRLMSTRGNKQTTEGTMPSQPAQHGIAGAVGAFSSLLGIGGGVIGVLLLTQFGRSVHRAVGTAAGFGLAIAIPGTFGYLWPAATDTEVMPWRIGLVSIVGFLAIASGTFFGAPIGASTAAKLDAKLLTRIFASYAALTGILMLKEAVFG